MVSSNVNDVGSLDGVVCCFCCVDFFSFFSLLLLITINHHVL